MKTEINMKDNEELEHAFVDMEGICNLLGLRFFAYREYVNTPENLKKPEEHREYKLAHFVHERNETTGVHFYRKRLMAEMLCNFAAAKASPKHRRTSLIEWAAQQGYNIKTELTPEQVIARDRARAERYKE